MSLRISRVTHKEDGGGNGSETVGFFNGSNEQVVAYLVANQTVCPHRYSTHIEEVQVTEVAKLKTGSFGVHVLADGYLVGHHGELPEETTAQAVALGVKRKLKDLLANLSSEDDELLALYYAR